MGTEELTDLSYLREIAMGDDDIVIETTEAFLDDTPSAIQDLQDYYGNQKWEKLHKQAHKMKPGIKYMGMDEALELIIDIEEQAKSGNISDDMGSQIKRIKNLCTTAIDELLEKVDGLKSAEG